MQTLTKQQTQKKSLFSTKVLVQIAILSAIASIFRIFEIPIPVLFPGFLKIDISDVPALIGGMALGPLAGFLIVVVKNLFQVAGSMTGGVGELANIMIGGSYVVLASYIYRKTPTLKGATIGVIAGTVAMVISGTLLNYFVMLPLYGQMMGLEAIIGMGSAINPNVTTLLGFVLWFIAPFNVVKGIIISVVTIPLYRKMEKHIQQKRRETISE